MEFTFVVIMVLVRTTVIQAGFKAIEQSVPTLQFWNTCVIGCYSK